jgi:transposase
LEHLVKKHELLPGQITTWKAQALENFSKVFSKDSSDEKDKDVETQILYAQIGQLKVEDDFLIKTAMRGTEERKKMFEPYTAKSLYTIFKKGILTAPYLWEARAEFKEAVKWKTALIDGAV